MLQQCLILPIRFYQKGISPLMPGRCRFYPSCSNYSIEAIQKHGAYKGMLIAVRRILKCGPWHPGGIDPVPDI